MLKKFNVVMLVFFLCISIFCINVKANTVEFRGEEEGLIATPDDFFLNIADLMPGDTKEDVAYIKNTTNDTIEVFFKTEPLDRSEYFDDIDYSLLEKISLKITLKKAGESDETVIYNGNLGAESLSEYISLGEYQKGYDGEFKFHLEVPTTLRNEYTVSNTKVKWIFMVVKDEEEPPPEPKPDEGGNNVIDDNGGSDSNQSGNSSRSKSRVKTGDNILYAVIALGIVVIIAVIVLFLKKKSSKDDKKDN